MRIVSLRVAATVLALFAAAFSAQAQEASAARPLWGGLQAGPYAVGFTVSYHLDRSRTWIPFADSLRRGEFSRPVRISIWYPADRASLGQQKPMTERGYFYRRAPDAYSAKLDSLIENADVAPVRDFIFGKSDSLFRSFVNLPTAAYEGAAAYKGSFPLVMYSEGYNNRSHDNSVLAEFLASHGYVVATVPQVGIYSTRLTLRIAAPDLETQTRDIEFAMAEAQKLPFVDPTKVAAMGYSMGGIISLMLAARNPNIDAVVGLDASFRAPRFVPLVVSSPSFNIRDMRAPLLSLQSGHPNEAGAQDTTVVDSLRFADRYVAQVGKAMHGDFSDFPMMASLFPVDIQGRSATEARSAHDAVALYVLRFLDATLRGDRAALAFVARSSDQNGMEKDLVRMRARRRIEIPSENDFVALIQRQGFTAAAASLVQARQRYPTLDVIDYVRLNRLGYGLIEARDFRAAVDVFRLNAEAHPGNSDAYDSLAEGLVAAGDTGGAIKAYRRMIEILPADSTLTETVRAELRAATEKKIAALEKQPH